MTDGQQRAAAKEFAEHWQGRGDEKQDTQVFWIGLLRNVYGVEQPEDYIQFELPVKLSHTSFIDAYIPEVEVLIEQKGADVSLRKGIRQSDGSLLTPYEQAFRYRGSLPYGQNVRWIVVCNFQTFEIHDMKHPQAEPDVIRMEELPKEYYRLNFLAEKKDEKLQREEEISMAAGDLVGRLYDAFAKQYADPTSPEAMHSLNVLCVRLVFCLYAEDAGIFGGHTMFRDYMEGFETHQMRKALAELFDVLDTPEEKRNKYLAEDDPRLAAFPYVNGGLFSGAEEIEIPPFTEEIRHVLLDNASAGFDWSEISPTIFGAVFESTLNPETRRSGGMHYTSIENIHKVIDPLFLNGLKEELNQILTEPVEKTRKRRLDAFQEKLAGLRFLDPAAGSGNFLTESYLSLRRLENQVILEQNYGQTMLDTHDPIRVKINQFYGIEINDFAVTVARTALWIAESQMLRETEEIVRRELDFLPLKTQAGIVEGNALRLDWETVVPKREVSYIMGNPPFVGAMWCKGEKREDIALAFPECAKPGEIDYVAGWYAVASRFIQGTSIRCAFVSTNSICQGQQVALLWAPLMKLYGIQIDFAYRTFRWDSEANLKAHVHCVIVGFSQNGISAEKMIFDDGITLKVNHINGYLTNADDVFIVATRRQVSNMPLMHMGSMARDGGYLVMSKDEYEEYIAKEPQGRQFIHPYMMGREFINNIPRYCFWLVGANPSEIKKCPLLLERLERVRQHRLNSPAKETQAFADTPGVFCQLAQPKGSFIAFPKVSSERRRYIPIGFLSEDIIVGDKIYVIENVGIYHFGVLTSNVHNAWMRAVAGRLKSDYSYSNTIVYNNFPWPTPTDEQRARIEQTAQAILDARALYPDSSLADLYDNLTMPPELRTAHQHNDRAVMDAYGFPKKGMTESACVAELMRMYQTLCRG